MTMITVRRRNHNAQYELFFEKDQLLEALSQNSRSPDVWREWLLKEYSGPVTQRRQYQDFWGVSGICGFAWQEPSLTHLKHVQIYHKTIETDELKSLLTLQNALEEISSPWRKKLAQEWTPSHLERISISLREKVRISIKESLSDPLKLRAKLFRPEKFLMIIFFKYRIDSFVILWQLSQRIMKEIASLSKYLLKLRESLSKFLTLQSLIFLVNSLKILIKSSSWKAFHLKPLDG